MFGDYEDGRKIHHPSQKIYRNNAHFQIVNTKFVFKKIVKKKQNNLN